MAQIQVPFPGVPADQDGQTDLSFGFLVENSDNTVLGIYGHNNTDDTLYLEVTLDGAQERTFRQTLPPHTPYTERLIPVAQRLKIVEVTKTHVRGVPLPVPIVKTRFPFQRMVCERQFAHPRRSSPVVLSITQTLVLDATTHNISLPSTVDANDGLVIGSGANDQDGVGASIIPGNPTGFTTPTNGTWEDEAPAGTFWAGGRSCIKVATGSEDGTTVAMNTASTTSMLAQCYRIQAGTYNQSAAALEASTTVHALGTSADPPSLSPSWGATGTTLWIAFAFVQNDLGGAGFNAEPGSYTFGAENEGNGTFDCAIDSAYRTLSAASENPGTFTWTGSQNNEGWVLALQDVVSGGGGGGRRLLDTDGTSLRLLMDGTSVRLLMGSPTTPQAVDATSTFTAAMTRVGIFKVTVASTSTVTPVLTRVAKYVRAIAATSTVVPAISKRLHKLMEVSSTFTAVLGKALPVLLQAVSTVNPGLATRLTSRRNIDATSTMVAEDEQLFIPDGGGGGGRGRGSQLTVRR